MKAGRVPGSLAFEVAASYEAMSRRAGELIIAELKRKPDLILCASAGGTPTRTYEILAEQAIAQPQLFSKMRVLQIDEWGGLEARHPATCEEDLRMKLLEPLRIAQDRYTGFKTDAADPQAESARIAEWLRENGPIDVCILGLGLNGHVAMNEPGESLAPHAHVAELTKSSLEHPMLKGLARKPRYGLTVGMTDILLSRTILLLVNGAHKRSAVERLKRPSVTTQFPASFLWLHQNALVLCDSEAAGTKDLENIAALLAGLPDKPAGSTPAPPGKLISTKRL